MRTLLCLLLTACSSSGPTPAKPAPGSAVAEVPDAAPPDAAPDAGPSPELAAAPAWIFRFTSPERTETWSVRYLDGKAVVVVDRGTASTTYLGTATDGTTLALAASAGPDKLSLDCKKAKRAVCTSKTSKATKKIDLLDCYHPDFKAPMVFAAAPGLEFDASTCKAAGGYTLIAP